MNKKVLIGPSRFGSLDKTPWETLKNAGFDVTNNPFGRKIKKEELIGLLKGVTGIIAGLETLDREVLENSELAVISRCGVGMDNVDIEYAKKAGIKVYSTPDGPTDAVAELTIGAMLSMLRMIPKMNSGMRNLAWPKTIGTQLSGKCVLVIGLGRIGRKVAEILKAFRANVIAVDPNVPSDKGRGIKMLSLKEALPIADIITIHSNSKEEVLGEKEFRMMKKGAYLLNSSRGSAINEDALGRVIEDGALAGAWLDTFKEEPYEGSLIKYENIILTPHVGSYTKECRLAMEMESVHNLIKGFSKK